MPASQPPDPAQCHTATPSIMTKRSCISPKDSTLPLKKRRVLVERWEEALLSPAPHFTPQPSYTPWTAHHPAMQHLAVSDPCNIFSPAPFTQSNASMYPFRPWSSVPQVSPGDFQVLTCPPSCVPSVPYSQAFHGISETEAALTPKHAQRHTVFQEADRPGLQPRMPLGLREKSVSPLQPLAGDVPQVDIADSGISESSADSSLEDLRLEAQMESFPSPRSDVGAEIHPAGVPAHKERRFDCEDCGRKFKKRAYLVRHRRLHTGERPYSCDICSATFSQMPNLWYHKRIHTGESPYECAVCQRKFRSSSHLKRHQRLHTGETPYACPSCPAAFITWDKLNRHKMIDHP
ncbi:zinc finger protein 184-like [Penaeus chinensis]|uniref:zinc finger protein 184-like n=1 Tax=Penaeus chinensis TaxID=139456 RepID=UPI001FB5BC2E|nr:zinc finger protein 184-like [Penaeus chinensis]